MIANFRHMFPQSAHCLLDSEFEFYLTGSRFFGTQTEDSDWDFFVGYSKEVVAFLIENNFRIVNDSEYEDSNTVAVYRYMDKFNRPSMCVDVQVVLNPAMKEDIQNKIKPVIRNSAIKDKEAMRLMWNVAYRLSKSQSCDKG